MMNMAEAIDIGVYIIILLVAFAVFFLYLKVRRLEKKLGALEIEELEAEIKELVDKGKEK
jgi:hypothetical protein